MSQIDEILNNEKSMIIAPAGYGKTHFITSCVSKTSSKNLILTHTHAGVASLRQKLKNANIKSKRYNVETITSFAQKYVIAYSDQSQLPPQENSKEYYPYIIEKAIEILSFSHIKAVIRASYSMLFVDEYQDCSEDQHQFVLSLAEILQTCILGDPMQGIFDFSTKNPIDLTDKNSFNDFWEKQYELSTPWRWKNNGNIKLGNDLKQMRQTLSETDSVNLTEYESIDLAISNNPYVDNYSKIMKIISENESLLVIIPDSKQINKRLEFQKRFLNRTIFLEAIDGKDFYILAKKCDEILVSGTFPPLLGILNKIFNKTAINNWFNDTGIKKKANSEDKIKTIPVKEALDTFLSAKKTKDLACLLSLISKLPKIKCYRKDLLYSLIDALMSSHSTQKSVYHSMMEKRNFIRRAGRSVNRKCVGTTLLTKGLEFETVLIMNCQEFSCRRNFYVAATRATKKLYIISDRSEISFS